MTLREEIINLSGETLEEGKFGKFLTIAALVAAAAIGAVKGIPAAKGAYNQYKYASAQTVSTKYMKADMAANHNLANWKRNIKIDTNYYTGQKQPILNIDIKMSEYVRTSLSGDSERTEIAEDIQNQILKQLDLYLNEIKANSSKLEKYFSKDTYIDDVKPLKVQLDFKATDEELKQIDNEKITKYNESANAEFDWLSRVVGMSIRNEIANKLGINREYIDTFINGQAAAFKK